MSDQRQKRAFASVAVVLLGTTVFLTLRDPAPEPRQDSRAQPPTVITTIETGPPPPTVPGEPALTSPPPPAPPTRSAPVAPARDEREAVNAPAIAPRQARAATAAARAFLDGYLPYSYGQAETRRIPAAAAMLLLELEASPPRVPASVAEAHPRVVSVRARAATGDLEVDVLAVVEDGQRRYDIALAVRDAGDRWVVTAVSG